MQTIDLTPTWAGLMPALIACLQNGTPEGQEGVRAELMRLAALTDANNATAKAAPTPEQEEEARNQFGLESVRLGRERAGNDIARHARTLQAAGLFELESVVYSAAAIADPESAGDYQAAALAAKVKHDKAAESVAEALAMARSCLGAYPDSDLERQKGGAQWRATAKDLRATLAGLVEAMEGGKA